MKTLKENLPKERKPILIENNNCLKLKNIKCIHDYYKFNKFIKPFKNIIKPDYLDKFLNTCNIMFNKVGYGAFVFILEGNIHTFQLFANTTQVKPGSQSITKKTIVNYYKKTKKNNRIKNISSIKNVSRYGINYCTIEFINKWWETYYITIYYDLLNTVLKNTTITTCFFLNLYDFPILYKHNCNQTILNEEVCSKNEYINNRFIPILSGSITNDYYDKCITNADSWEIVSQKKYYNYHKNIFTNRYDNNELKNINRDWDTKKNELIFRGTNNSCYLNDVKKNDRLYILKILKKLYYDKKLSNKININIGFNNITQKSIIEYKKGKINIFTTDKKLLQKNLGEMVGVDTISIPEQSNCKYILNINGYVDAWRLSYEIGMNSCIILIMSKYKSWFFNKLQNMKNVYIIDINSKTIEDDLYHCLQTLERNDNIGKKIAGGALKLYDEIINFDYIKKYMTTLLSEKEFDILIK